MRIAQVVPYCSATFGGGYEYELSRALMKLGHDVTIFTSDRTPYRYRTERGEEDGHDDVRLKRFRALLDLKELPVTPSMLPALLDEDLDVIQTSEPFQLCSLYAALASRRQGVPLVVSQHLYYTPWDPLKRLGLHLSGALYGRLVLGTAKRIIAISRAARSYLEREKGVKAKKIEVIPIGVDADRFTPTADPYGPLVDEAEGRKVILFVGRLTTYKGVGYLLQAFSRLAKEYREAVLCIRGDGPQRPYLLQLESRLGLRGRVLWLGYIANRDMPSLYAASNLFVLPSLIEPFGISALEAMASGKPVVATRVGGLADLVEEGVNGYLVPPGSVEGLEEAMLRTLKDEGLERRLGGEGRRRVERYFSWDVVARRILSLYEDLL